MQPLLYQPMLKGTCIDFRESTVEGDGTIADLDQKRRESNLASYQGTALAGPLRAKNYGALAPASINPDEPA
jgi:hypothetical protein